VEEELKGFDGNVEKTISPGPVVTIIGSATHGQDLAGSFLDTESGHKKVLWFRKSDIIVSRFFL